MTKIEQVPKAWKYVLAFDNGMSGWGHGLPEESWVIFPCANQKEVEVVTFNVRFCRPEMAYQNTFSRGMPQYTLPRDEKKLAAKLKVYSHSIVGAFLAQSYLAGSGLYEWFKWKARTASVITGRRWFEVPGMDHTYEDDNGVPFMFETTDHHQVEKGEYYLDTVQEINRELPKRGRSFEREEKRYVRFKGKSSKYWHQRPRIRLL